MPAPDPASNPGVLLVNLGTPDQPTPAAVRRYLKQFLSDPFVIDIPAPLRFLLLRCVILPFRPKRAAAAYASVWTERGSPLLFHSRDLCAAVRERLERPVALGMRYGHPSLDSALAELQQAGVQTVQVLPLFPQFSESAWETAAVETRRLAAARGLTTDFVPPFFAAAGFLDAQAAIGREHLAGFAADKILFSFHGLPERHVHKTDRSPAGQPHCLSRPDCCHQRVPANRDCYRAQCFVTARGLAERLGLDAADYEITFQSRLGRTPWIQPFTDARVVALPDEGCRRLAVFCPSFVADCLETLEEIAIRARADFQAAGGEELLLIPSVNSSPAFVDAVVGLLG